MSGTLASPRNAIGILGGIGPQASARLHAEIVRKATAATTTTGAPFPEIVHVSVRVPQFTAPGDDQDRAVEIIARAATTISGSGASVVGLACNTAHILLPRVEALTGVSVERIPAQVSAEIRRRGVSRVGLLATQETIDRGLYAEVEDVAALVPADRELTARVHRHIVGVYTGTHTRADAAEFAELVKDFRSDAHLDAVILGCTELPVAFGDADRSDVIDSIDVLADHLLAKHSSAQSLVGAPS